MIDLTVKDSDKDYYIVDMEILEDGTYIVRYASGREEVFPFSIHNFKADLFRMERQYVEYGDNYLEREFPNIKIRGILLSTILFLNVSYIYLMVTDTIDTFMIFMFIYMFYSLVVRGIPYLGELKKYMTVRDKLEVIKLYLENKKQFLVDIELENSKDVEEWSLINLANIDQFNNVDELNQYALDLTDEERVREANDLTLKLNKSLESRVKL